MISNRLLFQTSDINCSLQSFSVLIRIPHLHPGLRSDSSAIRSAPIRFVPLRSSAPRPAEMRSAIRTGALRGLPTATSGPLHSGLRGLQGCTTHRLPVGSPSYFHSKPPDCSEALATAAKLPDAEPVPPVTPRERITIADIKERRAKAGRLVAPTAAYCDADMFKAPVRDTNPCVGSPLTQYPLPLPISHNSNETLQGLGGENMADAVWPVESDNWQAQS